METIRFETNIPVTVALKFDDGKLVEGRYGEQVYYTATDVLGQDCALYVQPIVADKIKELGIRKGEQFSITKRERKDGQRKSIEWLVSRKPDLQVVQKPQQPLPTAAAAVASTPIDQRHERFQDHTESNPSTAVQGLGVILRDCLTVAVDELGRATKYAAGRGMRLEFNEEDVRTAANSLFIQYFKAAEINARYGSSVGSNGGSKWQQ